MAVHENDGNDGNDPPATGDGQGEESQSQSVDARFTKIESEQERQGGLLQQILDRLPGGGPKDQDGSGAGDAPAGQNIGELVKRGVEEIQAKQKADADAAAAKDADSAWRSGVDQHIAEHKPAEPATGRKTKLQKLMFGPGDQR